MLRSELYSSMQTTIRYNVQYIHRGETKFKNFVTKRTSIEQYAEMQKFMELMFEWNFDNIINKTQLSKETLIKSCKSEIKLKLEQVFTSFIKQSNLNLNLKCLHVGSSIINELYDPISKKKCALTIRKGIDFGNITQALRILDYLVEPYYEHPNKDRFILSLIEYCPYSLNGYATRTFLRKKTAITVEIGRKVAQLLSDLHSKNLVWKDLKPSNILIRENGDLAISDYKNVLERGDHILNNLHEGVTRSYLPPDLRNQLSISSSQEVEYTWLMIHNYIFANLLYQQMTGFLVRNDIQLHQEKSARKFSFIAKFDFSTEIFSTSIGSEIKKLIIGLSNNQIDYLSAGLFLSALHNKAQFWV